MYRLTVMGNCCHGSTNTSTENVGNVEIKTISQETDPTGDVSPWRETSPIATSPKRLLILVNDVHLSP